MWGRGRTSWETGGTLVRQEEHAGDREIKERDRRIMWEREGMWLETKGTWVVQEDH